MMVNRKFIIACLLLTNLDYPLVVQAIQRSTKIRCNLPTHLHNKDDIYI